MVRTRYSHRRRITWRYGRERGDYGEDEVVIDVGVSGREETEEIMVRTRYSHRRKITWRYGRERGDYGEDEVQR